MLDFQPAASPDRIRLVEVDGRRGCRSMAEVYASAADAHRAVAIAFEDCRMIDAEALAETEAKRDAHLDAVEAAESEMVTC